MATSTIATNYEVIDVTNKITFLKSVNTSYTFFYKVGPVVYYQIYFNESIASGTTVATIAEGLRTTKQFWCMIGYSNGGTNYKRVSVSGANISVVGAVVAGDFASGYFIPSAV